MHGERLSAGVIGVFEPVTGGSRIRAAENEREAVRDFADQRAVPVHLHVFLYDRAVHIRVDDPVVAQPRRGQQGPRWQRVPEDDIAQLEECKGMQRRVEPCRGLLRAGSVGGEVAVLLKQG
jgi:hypothetical protein